MTENIVFFGKGGIGKSTIAANISLLLAARGRKVLHVGCDPKRDSTLALTGTRIRPFNEEGGAGGEAALRRAIRPGLKGVDCLEAGGPQAGIGCAGAGIGSMLDAVETAGLLKGGSYDLTVFDVLGDVVCGGFAAPLRRGFAGKAVLVVSEELLSLYAANNLIAMVNNYARNGVYLAGLAVNAKDPAAAGRALDFARAVNTTVLGVIPRDTAVGRAEKARKPVAAFEPSSEAARALARLAGAIAAARKPSSPPRPLTEEEFEAFASGRAPARETSRRAVSAIPPAELLAGAGFTLTGMLGGQVACSWKGAGETLKLFLVPARDAGPGMTRRSDWAFCFAHDSGPGPTSSRAAFDLALEAVSGLSFSDLLAAFGGSPDFYGDAGSFGRAAPAAGGDAQVDAYTGFGQWQRFIFSDTPGIWVPPGAALVEHGDAECRFSSCAPTPLGSFRKSGGLSCSPRPSLAPFLPKDNPDIVNTGFGPADAVHGDGPLVRAALAAAARRTGPGGLVEFYNGCPALVQAGDAAARGSVPTGVDLVLDRSNSFDEETPEKLKARIAFAARRLAAHGRRKPAFDVCLTGFARSARESLAALLAERGVTAAPETGDFYGDALAARLRVLPHPDPVMTGAFDERGLKWVSPPPPYGPTATAAWLKEIFSALGRKAAASGFGPSKAEAAECAALSRRLARHAAGFVAAPEEFELLEGSWAVSRLPLVSLLSEAGLSLRLFAYAPDKAARLAAASEASRLGKRTGAKPRLVCFDSQAGLLKALRADKALRLVYSDVPLDPRLAAAGKNAFSAWACEPGYGGAVETLRRLLRLCEWDFNERYFGR